ncbi:MAG: PorV/PorQ family protein [bacterium]|nr:PorV/PorQ family protein [bacterium]
MKKTIRPTPILPALVLLGVCAAGPLAGQSKVGTTAVPFLGITAGPRAFALGGAFAAMGDDASSIHANPGAFSRMPRSQALATTTNWLVGTRYNWIGCVLKVSAADAVGFSFAQLDYGDDDVTTVLAPEGTGEKWSAADFALGLSYSRNLSDRFSIGGTAKYIQAKIYHETASAFAADIGLLFFTPFHDMRLGMSISNFGTDLRMDGRDLLQRIDLDPDGLGNNEAVVSKLKTDGWPLPLFFRVGLAGEVLKNQAVRVTLLADALRPSDNTETVQAGCEAALYERLFLRAGYKSMFREDAEEGPAFGCGVRLPVGGNASWRADYAYADYGILQSIQTIAVGIDF